MHLINRDHVNRDRVYRITDVDGAAEALVSAKSVVIVPGYGLGEKNCYTRIFHAIYILFFISILLFC